MKVYVIRHGLTEMNKKGLINGFLDDVLAPEGEDQARAAALLLPNTIKHIYSSPLYRTKQTAEILNEKLEVDLTFHDELKEVNFGDLQGTPFLDEYKEKHKGQKYDWRPSGESVEDVKKRVLKILKNIANKSGNGEALIVTSGGIVRLMYLLESGKLMGEIGNASMYNFDLEKILKN